MMSRDVDMSVTSSGMARAIGRVKPIEIGGPRHEAACRGLVLASAGTLFLHDAATVGVSYTLRVSYALMAIATVLGVPFVIRGWRSAPAGVKLAGAFLVLVYVVSGLIGINPVLPGQARGSSTRWIVYLVDLGVGLASVGLLLGLFRDGRRIRQLATTLAVGGVAAAAYGIYQWLAQHYGLPFSNLDNAPNSEGLTTGARFQGLGLLGWERVRGTFVEPFYFGIYLAAILPLVTQLPGVRRSGDSRSLAWVGVPLVLAAFVLTDSSLAWFSLLMGSAVVGMMVWVKAGRPLLAGAAAAGVALLIVLCTLVVADPGVLSALTARSDAQLHLTVSARTTAWTRANETWARRPVLGYGPGASSVKLEDLVDPQTVGVSSSDGVVSAPVVVLGSAQGIWAASLVDAGVLGLLAWIVMFGAVFYHVGSVAMKVRSRMLWAAMLAALVAVLAAEVGRDRLDLHVWVLVAFGLLVSHWGTSDIEHSHPIHETRS
jgi:O-antigen ligase